MAVADIEAVKRREPGFQPRREGISDDHGT